MNKYIILAVLIILGALAFYLSNHKQVVEKINIVESTEITTQAGGTRIKGYRSAAGAARAMFKNNKAKIDQANRGNLEIAAAIYKQGNRYFYTDPVLVSWPFRVTVSYPRGTKVVAAAHSHPPDNKANSGIAEQFSEGDANFVLQTGLSYYLMTPDGRFKTMTVNNARRVKRQAKSTCRWCR